MDVPWFSVKRNSKDFFFWDLIFQNIIGIIFHKTVLVTCWLKTLVVVEPLGGKNKWLQLNGLCVRFTLSAFFFFGQFNPLVSEFQAPYEHPPKLLVKVKLFEVTSQIHPEYPLLLFQNSGDPPSCRYAKNRYEKWYSNIFESNRYCWCFRNPAFTTCDINETL